MIDHPLVGIGSGVGEKSIDLRRRRWQPGKIERSPPQDRELVRLGSKRGLAFPELRHQEGVNRRPASGLVLRFECRRIGSANRLKRPVGAFLGRDVDPRRQTLGLIADRPGPRRDPALDHGDLIRRHFLLRRRHLASLEAIQEQALRGLSRNDRQPALPSPPSRSRQPQVELPLELWTSTVAVEAIRLEDRPDVPLKRR